MNLRSILLACLAAAQSAQAAIKVACFGDSVTAGTAAKGKPWPKQIRSVLGAPAVRVGVLAIAVVLGEWVHEPRARLAGAASV